MKKRFISMLLVLAVLVAAFPSSNVEAASRTKKKAYKAYYKWMKSDEMKISDYREEKFNKFKLVDLDNDKIPELIALYEDRVGTDVNTYAICTFDGKKVNSIKVCSGVAGAGGFRGSVSYIPKKGKIAAYSMSSGTGSSYDTYYKIKKGKIVITHTLTMERTFYPQQTETYKVNKKVVSKSKFEKTEKKIYASKKSVNFDKLKFISKKKMLKKLK